MEVAMPMSGSAIDCYEDMFKEITRKLYGEDGLPELTNDRLGSSTDRGLTPIDYEVDNPILKPEEHLTAFGLAALMQNGFSPSGILNSGFQPHKVNTGIGLGTSLEDKWITSDDSLQWTQSKIATYNPSQKLFRCTECDCVGYLPRVSEHWLGTHSNLRAFHCSQCPYESAWARCVRMHLSRQHNINTDENNDLITKNNPVLKEINNYLQRLKSKLESNCSKTTSNQIVDDFQSVSTSNLQISTQSIPAAAQSTSTDPHTSKRYSCTYCPYATDRRDLFTRHENIHREEKPFQCYVCQKQFNRADHVKKHFLRMHREHPYDLNRIRRHPPKNASGMSYYQKYNANQPSTDSLNTLTTINSLSIPNSFNTMARAPIRPNDIKTVAGKATSSKSAKKKGEKRFTCCYCSWSGVDNWCLKRHMNTHLKPFVCGLCDYKAARSERLATHVLKVHNKRVCGKCSFLADDITQLSTHQQEHHPLEERNRSGSSNVLRTNSFNNSATAGTSQPVTSTATSANCSLTATNVLKTHDLSAAAALLQQHTNRFLQQNETVKSWKSHTPKQHGAARLFNYMEASDGSEPETESRGAEDMSRLNLSHRLQSDFPEAGGVGSQGDEENADEVELPLFFCSTCGCEFEDDLSLETHQYTHRHSATSPAKPDDSLKENVDPVKKYRCCLCEASFDTQSLIMTHMIAHSSLVPKPQNILQFKRSRKQSRPKKVLSIWDADEADVLQHLNGKLRKWRIALSNPRKEASRRLIDKYMTKLVIRRGLTCVLCKNNGLSRYHTKASLALHHYWRHSKKRFKCEHCEMEFRHRYQCVLHSSRVHINPKPPATATIIHKDPTNPVLPIESMCSSQDSTSFFSHHTVPEATLNAPKLGMSFFDHSFIHPSNAINNHMPIIIPTFPPN